MQLLRFDSSVDQLDEQRASMVVCVLAVRARRLSTASPRAIGTALVAVVGGARGPHHAPPLVEQGLEPPAHAPHTWRYPRRVVIHLGAGGERAGRSALPSPLLDRDRLTTGRAGPQRLATGSTHDYGDI
eukprot:COSAG02_NODE_753_length_17610_cov_23.119753_11_plen_129_part_00